MANEEQLHILRKQGVEAWNAWRRQAEDIQVDLSGAKLDMYNLQGANLGGANLSGARLIRANLSPRTRPTGAFTCSRRSPLPVAEQRPGAGVRAGRPR